MSKLRPILFSTAMVQAILDGRKTQTRRVVKPQPMHDSAPPHKDGNQWVHMGDAYKCPYGQPGDILWVRETWNRSNEEYYFKASEETFPEYIKRILVSNNWDASACEWRPSIHMPFSAARIFLRIKSVRVERLQQISEEDSIHEGIGRFTKDETFYKYGLDGWEWISMARKPSDAFRTLWQSINGPESWNANPWVWVVEFDRISREEAGV